MEQYRMCELEFQGEELHQGWAQVNLSARLWCGSREIAVSGFYAGGGRALAV